MRIAMVGPFGLQPNRTMSSRALPLARALVKRGHEIALFMPPWQTPQESGRQWSQDEVLLRYTDLGRQPMTTVRNLIGDVLAWQPALIHGFKPKAYSGLAMWWFWQFQRGQRRLLLDMDDWEGPGGWNDLAPYTAIQKRFFTWQERWGIGHAHAITVASTALQSIVWSKGVAADSVHYIPNGSGLPQSTEAPLTAEIAHRRQELGLAQRPTVLVYSRFFEFESSRLAQILASVKQNVPQTAFLFIGESLFAQHTGHLRQALDTAGVLPAVIDLGWVDEAELLLTLQLADVAIYLMDDTLLNRCKCPVKLADLIAAGLPVVAEEVGQVPAYVAHQENGLLRSTGDVSGVAEDIVTLLQQAQVRDEFGRAAQQRYEKYFSWDHLAHKLDAAYRQSRKPESDQA